MTDVPRVDADIGRIGLLEQWLREMKSTSPVTNPWPVLPGGSSPWCQCDSSQLCARWAQLRYETENRCLNLDDASYWCPGKDNC